MRTLLATLTVLLAVAACSSSSTPSPPVDDSAGSCRVLAKECHPHKTPLGIECHELGHEGDDAKCGPRKAECLAACPAIDGGDPHADAGGDAGQDAAGDAGQDAGDPVCAAYCTCMVDTCATVPGYPYTTPTSCAAACAAFTAAERLCWPKFCESAKLAADKAHDCEHAWGKDPHCD
jgi:hypothetical protein